MKKTLSVIRWIVKLQWDTSRAYLAWGAIYGLISGLQPIVHTFIFAKTLASVSIAALGGGDVNEVYFWFAVMLLVKLITQISDSVDRVVRERMQQKIDLEVNSRFFKKMYELSQEQFDNEQFNTKLERAREGLHQMWRVLDDTMSVITSMIGFIGSIIVVTVASPVVGVILIVTVVPIVLIEMKQNKLREEVYKQIEPYDRVAFRSRWMLIDPNIMPEIRLMNAYKKIVSAWHQNMKKSQNMTYHNNVKMAKWDVTIEAVHPTLSFFANIYFFKLLLAGTIGFDRFILLRGMLEQANLSAHRLATSIQRLHELSINLRNFSEIYDTPPAIPDGIIKVGRPLNVEFRNVSFSYPGSSEKVLDNVSLSIAAGQKIAIVGENGAGKSTLIKLLLRQYLPTEGVIMINGFDIREIEQDSYYALISNLSQEFLVVNHLSIRDNLTTGVHGDVGDDEIRHAIDLAGATAFIDKLPHKLQTRLDTSFEDGTNLSGGQKQRLGIARALVRKGELLILDEPTSAIDAKAEYEIFNNIYRYHTGKTTLIVSHRFSTVRKADSIVVMENGKISEQGTHHELLSQGGVYKEMFELQAEGYR